MSSSSRELVRAAAAPSLSPPYSEGAPGPGRVLHGRFAVFSVWTEIRSAEEGHFVERFQLGAFGASIARDRSAIKALYHHGLDPSIGTRPLGPILRLEEDGVGAAYEVQLLDADYTRSLIPALEAGLLGASFRFVPIKARVERRPGRSAHNPDGLPEVTHQQVRLREFGPTPMPAYPGTSAGVRTSAPWWDRV